MIIEGNDLYFGAGLLATLGEKHRRQRKLLNPAFSTAHLRSLVPIFYQVTHRFRGAIAKKTKDGPQELDMLHWLSRVALEYIGQGGLGYSFEDFDDNGSPNEYTRAVKEFGMTLFSLGVYLPWIPLLKKIGSPRFRRFLIDLLPSKRVRKVKNIVDIMDNTSKAVLEMKKASLFQGDEVVSEQVHVGKDIMSVLLRENILAEEADRLPDDELTGQMSTLIFAAYETTSSALSHTLLALAQFPDVQVKLRKEVTAARREHEDMGYDDLMALPYLDAVVRESLRLYAPLNFLLRITQQDTVLPLGTPVKSRDGKKDIHEVALKRNTTILMNLAAVNRDPEIWGEDAELWRPERWLGRKPEDVSKVRIPGVYPGLMTFSAGGRSCIGFKFSELEMKMVLSVLLEEFSFAIAKEIIWRNSAVLSPATKGRENDLAHLPLIVSKLQTSSTK